MLGWCWDCKSTVKRPFSSVTHGVSHRGQAHDITSLFTHGCSFIRFLFLALSLLGTRTRIFPVSENFCFLYISFCITVFL